MKLAAGIIAVIFGSYMPIIMAMTPVSEQLNRAAFAMNLNKAIADFADLWQFPKTEVANFIDNQITLGQKITLGSTREQVIQAAIDCLTNMQTMYDYDAEQITKLKSGDIKTIQNVWDFYQAIGNSTDSTEQSTIEGQLRIYRYAKITTHLKKYGIGYCCIVAAVAALAIIGWYLYGSKKKTQKIKPAPVRK